MKIKRWMVITVGIIGFVYFYDFTKNSHGFSIENGSDQNITVLEIVNDNRKIVALREIPIPPNQSQTVGCSDTLSVSAYGGSTLQVTIKNSDHYIKTVSCKFEQSNGFFQRLFSTRDYVVIYDGNNHLRYESRYTDGGPYCEKYGINDKMFQFK